MDLAGTDLNTVIAEFETHRLSPQHSVILVAERPGNGDANDEDDGGRNGPHRKAKRAGRHSSEDAAPQVRPLPPSVRETDPGETLEGADIQYFADLMRGVVRRQRDIDPMIDHYLAEGWRLVRIDSTLRAILRAATFELLERTDVPVRVVISEYINIAHAFFDGDEPKVVNGVLDRIARKARAIEMPTPAGSSPSRG
ncbi:MAG: transcription antitermination factor NusB [Hyphomicrobiaceae bacterium]|nr:transcription antitermination factor NusB [Hyphomicrobiaceae bacterium]